MRSGHADKWLKGLKGLEIGGSAHNQFELDTLNVDFEYNDPYKEMEIVAAGQSLPVDIVANAWDIPVEDKSYDFVISSHVIEHIWDPIGALMEWKRIARKYIYLIVPQRNASPHDANRTLTTLVEIIIRHKQGQRPGNLGHVSIWTCENFLKMLNHYGFDVIDYLDPDDKVGNGFAVVIDASTELKTK